ncbi:MAG: hypothetical protein VB934_15640 [Polyangiaceae bacterium]
MALSVIEGTGAPQYLLGSVSLEPLSTLIRANRGLAPRDAVGWCVRLCQHVEALHRVGVAHGALSADCVLVASSTCEADGLMLDARRSRGLPGYFSPERHAHDTISVADDAWAIAVFLYFSLTAKMPFEGDTATAIAKNIQMTPRAPLKELGVDEAELQTLLDQFLARNIVSRVVRVAMLRSGLEAWLPDDVRASLEPLSEPEAESSGSPFGDYDDDDEVLTVMREGDELRRHLSQMSPLPQAPPEEAPDASATTDEESDDGGATVMMMSPLADAQLEDGETTAADDDEDWDGGAATMMMPSPADSDSIDEEDVATMMVDGVDADTLAALEAEVAKRSTASAPGPAAGHFAPAPPRAPRPPTAASRGGLPGWSSGAPTAATPMVSSAPPVGGPPQAAPMVAPPGPSPLAAAAAPELSSRDVLLRRALIFSLVVFALLLVAIVWLLLRRKGVI